MTKKHPPRPVGRPPEGHAAMAVTVPLRLSQELIDEIDLVIAKREGAPSRNAVMREAMAKGLRQMLESGA